METALWMYRDVKTKTLWEKALAGGLSKLKTEQVLAEHAMRPLSTMRPLRRIISAVIHAYDNVM
ncbi:hypothetical protein SAMN05216316_2774 [Nitrosovibrio sp. Nv6]|nr:hypothetical protein SAMN05216316_2774 [Nitrosovibrio sp. Nv6]